MRTDQVQLEAAQDLLLRPETVVVPHTDADGLAAGAIALRARREGDAGRAWLIGRGRTPFYDGGDLPPSPAPVAVLDWGVRPVHRPGLIVDHHAPEADARPDQVLISGFGQTPVPSTSVLMRRIVPDAPMWLAALGAIGDYGDQGLKHPELADTPHRTAIRKLVPLINAPRRHPGGPVRLALQLLLDHDDPREVLKDRRIDELEQARRAWRAGYDAAVRTAPVRVGDTYLIRFTSVFQVHPLVAQAWARRLAPLPVIAANDGYLPGRVNFAARGGSGNLRELLKSALPNATETEFANGHDRATGGSLPPSEFERLLRGLAAVKGTDFATQPSSRSTRTDGGSPHGHGAGTTVHGLAAAARSRRRTSRRS